MRDQSSLGHSLAHQTAPRPAAPPSLSSHAPVTLLAGSAPADCGDSLRISEWLLTLLSEQVPMANCGCAESKRPAPAARCLGGALACVPRARAQPSTARASWCSTAPRRAALPELNRTRRCFTGVARGSRLGRCHRSANGAGTGTVGAAELAAAAQPRNLGQPAQSGLPGACLRALGVRVWEGEEVVTSMVWPWIWGKKSTVTGGVGCVKVGTRG